MVVPAVYNIRASRNGDWDETIEFLSSGIPMDLTGWNVRMQVRITPGAPGDPLIDIGTDKAAMGAGSNITFNGNPNLGAIYVAVKGGDLQTIFDVANPWPTRLSHDIVLISPSGIVQSYLAGLFVLGEGVTRT